MIRAILKKNIYMLEPRQMFEILVTMTSLIICHLDYILLMRIQLHPDLAFRSVPP